MNVAIERSAGRGSWRSFLKPKRLLQINWPHHHGNAGLGFGR